MRFCRLLLHALLSLALVANGIGAAMASVPAVCAHAAIAAAALVSGSPCHEAMSADASDSHDGMPQAGWSKRSATPHDRMQHDNMHRSDMPQLPSASDKNSCSDCADHCECACVAHGLAALMPSTLLLPAAIGIAYTSVPPKTHAAPALPHPVRPPIG